MANPDLQQRIYKAQCIGNVEPIEYMVPYPNLHSLVAGQNIKYTDHLLYEDLNMTNRDFYRQVQQTAIWLENSEITKGDRVLVTGFSFPFAEILAFGIWTLGASLVLVRDNDLNGAKEACHPALCITPELNLMNEISSLNDKFNPKSKPLLREEALVFWENGKGIRLSHYNLLVNANGVQKILDLSETDSFQINLEANTTAWVVLQALLPLYSGALLTSTEPRLTIGLPGQFEKADYIVDFEWKKIQKTNPPHLFIKPENTAVLAISETPIHLTAIKRKNTHLKIEGHSVMMGYLDDSLNEIVFRNSWMAISTE